jgi:hypothetical protein
MGRGKGDIEAGGARTRSGSTEIVVIDNDGRDLKVGALVLDGTLPEGARGRGPAPKITEITSPTDGSVIVKLGHQDAAPGEYFSMLLGLEEPDGRFRTNLKLLGHERADGTFETVV